MRAVSGAHDQHPSHSPNRDHRHQGRDREAFRAQDARRGPRVARRHVAQPEGPELRVRAGPQDPGVGRVPAATEGVRAHGRRELRRVRVLPGPRLLRGQQQGARPGQGARGPDLARLGPLHDARARGDGVRRSDERHAAHGHGRTRRVAAQAARPGRPARADVVHRAGELLHAVEHRGRHRVLGPGGTLRTQAARRSLRRGMTDDPFVTHRSLLFTVAYELLGSAADAEDVVQETWLRWDRVDQSEIEDPRAYLARIVTRQSLNRLRTVKRRREEYVGEWLPEPLLTSPDVAEDVEFAESVSIAMLTVLETLKPAERAVFVLKEVFDFPYEDIAQAVEKSPAAVRQIAHRAREHVAARRPRIEVDRSEQQRVVDRFMAAIESGEVQLLLDVLAPDIVLVADGGGEVGAALRPIRGPKTVARLLSNFRSLVPGAHVSSMWVNGAPGARIELDGALDTVISLVVENGRVSRIYSMRNPH